MLVHPRLLSLNHNRFISKWGKLQKWAVSSWLPFKESKKCALKKRFPHRTKRVKTTSFRAVGLTLGKNVSSGPLEMLASAPLANLVNTLDGCEIHFAPPNKPWCLMIPEQILASNGFNHGFKVVQDFVHPLYCKQVGKCPMVSWSQCSTQEHLHSMCKVLTKMPPRVND